MGIIPSWCMNSTTVGPVCGPPFFIGDVAISLSWTIVPPLHLLHHRAIVDTAFCPQLGRDIVNLEVPVWRSCIRS